MPTQYLTPDVEKTILAFIRQGAYEHVAAEAAGISKEVYEGWIKSGNRKNAKSKVKGFVHKVKQAKAQARLLVEIEVREKDPRFWLTRGPGRETEGNPGWSKEVKPNITQNRQTINLLYSPEWNSLWAHILKVLSAFPEARAALAAELQNMPALPAPGQTTIQGN